MPKFYRVFTDNDIPSCHSFFERIQTGIYKDLYLDFTEFAKS